MSTASALRRPPAFTLVEVVLAIGVFALGIVAVLGLLGPTVRSVGATLDAGVASRLADAIQTELDDLGFAAATEPITLYANRDGARVGASGEIPAEARYFLVELSPVADAPGVRTFAARVGWPYLVPQSAAPVPSAQRNVAFFHFAVAP